MGLSPCIKARDVISMNIKSVLNLISAVCFYALCEWVEVMKSHYGGSTGLTGFQVTET